MDREEIILALGAGGVPYRDTISLQPNRESIRMTVPKCFWEKNGRSVEEPGEVEVFHYPDEGLLLVDFNDE